MAYVEVRKGRKLVARHLVDEEKARAGCRIRLGSAGHLRITLGECKTVGKYQVTMHTGLPPDHIEPACEQPDTLRAQSAHVSETKPDVPTEMRTDLPPGKRFPHPALEGYKVVARLGQGGMGIVWRAQQLSTKREVALKFLGKHHFAPKKARARFEREVSLAAQLTHPNIARVYHSGLHRGAYFYAMELIDGERLDTYVRRNRLSHRQILELMRTVCDAVAYAHERGIIHRDLKPSNILVTPDGQPHVVDFGLAKVLREHDSELTVSIEGEIAGTPSYMAPEQAAGRLDHISERSDVYSLGVILYRLLTDESPHSLIGPGYEILKRIVEEEVDSPRIHDVSIDHELESLILTALAREPEMRYPSAKVLMQDIANYLNGEPLLARSLSAAYRVRKRLIKYRRPVVIGALCLVIICSLAVSIARLIRVEREARQQAEDSLALGQKQMRSTLEQAEAQRQRELEHFKIQRDELLKTVKDDIRSIDPGMEAEAKATLERLEASIEAGEWDLALASITEFRSNYAQTATPGSISDTLAQWEQTISAAQNSEETQGIHKSIYQLQQLVSQRRFLPAHLLLEHFRANFGTSGTLPKYLQTRLESISNEIAANLNLDSLVYHEEYIMDNNPAQSPDWDMAYGEAVRELDRVKSRQESSAIPWHYGFLVLRIGLEDALCNDSVCLTTAVPDNRRRRLSGSGLFVIERGSYVGTADLKDGNFALLASSDCSGPDRSYALGIYTLQHYCPVVKPLVLEEWKIGRMEIMLRSIPDDQKGLIAVAVDTEEDLTNEQICLLRSGTGPRVYLPIGVGNKCISPAIAAGTYWVSVSPSAYGSGTVTVNLDIGETANVLLSPWRNQELSIDWYVRNPAESDNWVGTTVKTNTARGDLTTGPSFWHHQTKGVFPEPFLAVGWDGTDCTLRTHQRTHSAELHVYLKNLGKEDPVGELTFPGHGDFAEADTECKVVEGDVCAILYTRPQWNGRARTDPKYEMLLHIRSINPMQPHGVVLP